MFSLKKIGVWFLFTVCAAFAADKTTASAIELLSAPGTTRDTETTLIWSRPEKGGAGQEFEITRDGQVIAATRKTYFTVAGLKTSTHYRFQVSVRSTGGPVAVSNVLEISTAATGRRFDIVQFGAVGDGKTKATKAIQAAIDACTVGGTVVVPRGDFLTGALFLKSDMTLLLEEGAILRGSPAVEDYEPKFLNRFEGWELETFASLINAGRMDHRGPANVHRLSIRGKGTIMGGGGALGKRMMDAAGFRSRGRLILLMNCEDVEIEGVTLTEPPAWTLHYVYSKNVTIRDVKIKTVGVRNGDGIDPDSSVNSYIFNTTFETGDDCIAIKSGKNPEGNIVGRPTENVRIFDCAFVSGHGISIGSEMSGGVRNVLVEDCVAGALLHGFQVKATRDRGGVVENITVRNCELRKITVYTELPYNNDGKPAPTLPSFRNLRFQDIDLTNAEAGPVIIVNGYSDRAHRTRDVSFERIKFGAGAVVKIDQAENVVFKDISSTSGVEPKFEITRSENVRRP
jgi:polygalacturonase